MHVLWLLRELGLDPRATRRDARCGACRARDVARVRAPECDDNRFFEGELEPCINAQVAAAGAYFGQDVGGLVERLLGEQLEDGGWNCDAPGMHRRAPRSTRRSACWRRCSSSKRATRREPGA
jgi:hypothetical protein